MDRKLITVVTPCYNEEANVEALYRAVRGIFAELPQYRYRHLFIDNKSKDGTRDILRGLAAADSNVQAIFNARNFGHIRSPFHAIMEAEGDAVIGMACDFQDPPDLIPRFIAKWEEGHRIALGVKESAEESGLFYSIRSRYYRLLGSISDIELVQHATGFGIYDRTVVEHLRRINDPYPYFRGLLAEIGFEVARIPFKQPLRKRGVTSQNFYTLYDIAFLGIVSHSKVPLRLATMTGFAMGALSMLAAFGYLLAKLVFWNSFQLGLAPILIGFFFISAVQLVFVGILGEYIGAIYTQVRNHPHVFEGERLNLGVPSPRVDEPEMPATPPRARQSAW
jgi:glycosyltransferase involved in cell wall biosynthesis